jgi:hypothetical protein
MHRKDLDIGRILNLAIVRLLVVVVVPKGPAG